MSATGMKKQMRRHASAGPRIPNSQPLLPDSLRIWPARNLQNVWELLRSSYINVLLILVPFGLLSGILNWHPIARFTLNFLAIIPLQSLSSNASEGLALSLGQILGGLLNTILGSATELIVGIVALKEDEIRIVQASIMGSIFSRMLLIPGACFFVGGLKHREQMVGGSTVSTMLFPTLASIMILLAPTALHSASAGGFKEHDEYQILSLGCTIVLLLLLAANLVFQLKTHADSFDEVNANEEDLDSMEPDLNVKAAALILPLTLFLITVCARNLIRSLPPILERSGLNRNFIGFVLLPFLSGTAEQFTAMIVAYMDKAELAISVCIVGIMQTVLFVMPVLFIIGAMTDHPLNFFFGRWETMAVLCAAVLLTALVLRGNSNYLDGLLCLGFYSIIVISFCILPEEIHPFERDAGSMTLQKLPI